MIFKGGRRPPTPDELIAAEPPPAFPAWMVAADPRLAAEHTNGLYQALRRARLLYPRGRTWKEWVQRPWGVPPWAIVLAMFGALWVVAVPMVQVVGGMAVVPLTVLLIVCVHFIAPLFAPAGRMADVGFTGRVPPTWRGALRTTQARDYAAAMFLAWSVGARGREVLEAVYLEERQSQLLPWRLLMVTATALVIVAVGGAVYVATTNPGVAAWLLLLAVMLTGAGMLWAIGLTPQYLRPVDRLIGIVASWYAVVPWRDTPDLPYQRWLEADRRWRRHSLHGGLILTVLLVTGIAVVVGVVFWWGSETTLVLACAPGLLLLLGSRWWFERACRRQEACLDEVFDLSDPAFEYVAAVVSTGDVEGETRAFWLRYLGDPASQPPPDEEEGVDYTSLAPDDPLGNSSTPTSEPPTKTD